jgi:hypothetical protein
LGGKATNIITVRHFSNEMVKKITSRPSMQTDLVIFICLSCEPVLTTLNE